MSHSECPKCKRQVSPIVWHCPRCKAELPPLQAAIDRSTKYLGKQHGPCPFEDSIKKTRKCPSCKREYTAGVSTCTHCKVATMDLREYLAHLAATEKQRTGQEFKRIGVSLFPMSTVGQEEGVISMNRPPIERFENGNIKVDGIEYSPVERPDPVLPDQVIIDDPHGEVDRRRE